MAGARSKQALGSTPTGVPCCVPGAATACRCPTLLRGAYGPCPLACGGEGLAGGGVGGAALAHVHLIPHLRDAQHLRRPACGALLGGGGGGGGFGNGGGRLLARGRGVGPLLQRAACRVGEKLVWRWGTVLVGSRAEGESARAAVGRAARVPHSPLPANPPAGRRCLRLSRSSCWASPSWLHTGRDEGRAQVGQPKAAVPRFSRVVWPARPAPPCCTDRLGGLTVRRRMQQRGRRRPAAAG